MSHLLDTCLVSEMVKVEPHPGVMQWLAEQDEDGLFLSLLSIAELEKAVAKLAALRRKTRWGDWMRKDLVRRFEGRLLGIDLAVVQTWGALVGASERRGLVLPVMDSLIAATAITHQLRVVSRNVADFKRCGVECVNPWGAA